ncbi:hypothetical protein [Methylorubrum thiocyanatum]|uniref:hypothetical protein n=1 Tax=Methylorubrum thiocyanatum TaxID=47958 RepID=UPI0035C7C966
MNRHNLAWLGRLLYGEKFLRPFAAALTKAGPRTVHESHLGAWIRGDRTIPDWLPPQARKVLPLGVSDLQWRTEMLVRAALKPDFFDPHGTLLAPITWANEERAS